ncbi:hypothetical protein C3F09_04715 [candidate division GN15 bacterium]|uniref:DivIVA domain-containing protein n=1 Tax=candidate division GN15 bacterium TaxID=2072418 RepID=A0A855X8L5_9BACT|nr:MAG: hypothetical protein C3F09_04715 [candidate division GN15 bacterium]
MAWRPRALSGEHDFQHKDGIMELTPNDIRNYEFSNVLRGYDKEAVDAFKEQVALTLETLKQENLKLTMEVESTRIQLAGLKQFEDAIKNAAIDARRNADQTIANAKKEAETILSKATTDAEQALTTRSQRHAELESAIEKLDLAKKSYLGRLRQLISSHLEWLEEFSIADGRQTLIEEDNHLDVTETSELITTKRETVATAPSTQPDVVLEEANAAGKIITAPADIPAQPMVESLKAAIKDEPNRQPIDPELAQALENYRKMSASPSHESTGKIKTVAAMHSSGGFVTKNGESVADESTGKVPVTPQANKPADQNTKGDDDLSDVLDKVVSKFEEEMDKAARS